MKWHKDFVRWLVALWLIAELSFLVIPETGRFVYYRVVDFWSGLLGFANFDGIHYLSIASEGYKGLHMEAFFPGYPFVVRVVTSLLGHGFLAGWLVSIACFYLSVRLLYSMTTEIFDKKAAHWTVIGLLLFPSSFFFVSVYSESVFLLLALLVFYFARKKRWFLASMMALMAGLVRVNGIFLMAVVAIYFAREWWKTKSLLLVLQGWPIPLSVLGLGSYMKYLYDKFGDPLYFAHIQSFFNPQRQVDKLIFLHQVFYRYFKMMIFVDHRSFVFLTAFLELIVAVVFIWIILRGWKKLEWPMMVYSLGVFVLPTLTGTFSSLPRYILAIFPAFMIWGLWLSRMSPLRRRAVLIISGSGLIVYLMMFIRGYFVA